MVHRSFCRDMKKYVRMGRNGWFVPIQLDRDAGSGPTIGSFVSAIVGDVLSRTCMKLLLLTA